MGKGSWVLACNVLPPLIHADLRMGGIIRTRVDREHIFHMIHKVGVGLRRNTPALLQPRLEFVFFNTCRIVSWLTLSTISSSTTFSRTSRRLQRSTPSGFGPQSSATRCASASPSSLRFWGRGG